MAKLSEEVIVKEIEAKDFIAEDVSQYKNIKSKIQVRCGQNHLMETDMFSFRKDSFRCSVCHGSSVAISNTPPEKKGYRLLAMDNATQNMGISIFDDGELVYYSLVKFSGASYEDRLLKIFDTVNNIMIKNWQPDYIVFEDIQYQNNYQTYKKLAMLLGILIVAAKSNKLEYEVIGPTTWRSHYQIIGQRETSKLKAINLIKTMYNIDVVDDIAEAILIGRFVADKKLDKILKKAF